MGKCDGELVMYIALLVDVHVLQLKGDSVATEENPPNHCSFDVVAHISPVLQARHDAANAAKAVVVPPAYPAINIGFPPEMMAAFCAPPPLATPALPSYTSHMLLLLSYTPGTNMPIAQFCVEYKLDNSICSQLDDNSFKMSGILQYVVVDELKEMGFK